MLARITALKTPVTESIRSHREIADRCLAIGFIRSGEETLTEDCCLKRGLQVFKPVQHRP